MSKEIFCRSQAELESWLEEHQAQTESVWLVYYKPSTKLGSLNHDQILETVLRYGWVDSLVGKVDEEKTKIRISPRNPKSNWSKYNKDLVEKLISLGKMETNGLKMIQLAKRTGTWNALEDVEKLILPPDLKAALESAELTPIWDKLSRSERRGLLETLFNSKRPETRQKQIAKITTALQQSVSPMSGRKIKF